MASYDAGRARAVCLELKDNITTLYVNALAIFRASQRWTLNGLDPALPAPVDIRAQVAAFRALTIPALKLTDWGNQFLQAGANDTLSYPDPPATPIGKIQFESISFITLSF
jgi:hypothetical protein